MIDSEGSVVVGDQRALAGSPDEPVVPDRGGEGDKALGHACEYAVVRPSAMPFEPELALEGPEDRLHALPDPAQLPESAELVPSIWPEKDGRQLADEVLELPAGVPLVGHDERARRHRRALQHGLGDLALADLGVGQAPDDGDAVGRADEVQAQAPEEAAVGGAVAVLARPARSERLTVSREGPQGTGVESMSRSWSHQDGVRLARCWMASASNGPAARSRLL